MSGLCVEGLSKSFGKYEVLRDVDFDVAKGKFVCLLGPSGCGKTTLLRLVAGLDAPTKGKIAVNGVDITHVPAHRRDFGMVFQSLALFPHLTAGENIAYPLRIRGVAKAEQEREVDRLLELVRLPGIARRSISQLSGGQRQRVAIARALALKPKLFLLDEPMSALDAKLREALQIELKLLQERLGVTTILVTHDQREALTMADLVVVMSEGRIQQIAHPVEVYRKPATAFVASFIGTANILKGVAKGDGVVKVDDTLLSVPGAPTSGPVTISIRPEDLHLEAAPRQNSIPGTIAFVRHLGASVEVSVNVGHAMLIVVVSPRQGVALASGQGIHVGVDPTSCVVLP